MDNYFEVFGFYVSQWKKTGRLIIFFERFLRIGMQEQRMQKIWFFPICILTYALFCVYAYILLRAIIHPSYFISVGSFVIASVSIFACWKGLADYYFRKYRTEYGVCIRDASLQLFISTVVASGFLPFGISVSTILFFFLNGIFVADYTIRRWKKKQPDLTYVVDLPVDATVDISTIKDAASCSVKKVQISGEVRNCLALKNGIPVRIDLKGADVLSLGVGTKAINPSPMRLKIEKALCSGQKSMLFDKVFEPSTEFRDRVWNDVLIETSSAQEGNPDSVIYTLEGAKKDSSVYLSFPFTATHSSQGKSNIYILVIDSLRRDYLPSQTVLQERGYMHVAQLLQDSVLYDNAYTQGPWTLPTFASLLSGQYLSYHDTHHPREYKPISENITLLPEILHREGYTTFGYGTGPRTSPIYGYSRGFDKYYYKMCDKEHGVATAEEVFSWARQQDRKSGYRNGQCYYLHLLEAHWPFHPPRDFEWMYNHTSKIDVIRDVKKHRGKKGALDFDEDQIVFFKDLYRAEIDCCLYEVERYLAYLKDRDLYEDSLIVLMGDHGNNFGEHITIGSFDVYDEFVHVVMTAKYPLALNRKGVESGLVSANIDIAPTIVDMLSLKGDWPFNGRSLLNEITEKWVNSLGKVVISEDLYVNRYYIALRNKKYTFIYRTYFKAPSFAKLERNSETFELYDREDDPQEKENIFFQGNSSVKNEFFALLNTHVRNSLVHYGLNPKFEIHE